jgi:hypothetical protein
MRGAAPSGTRAAPPVWFQSHVNDGKEHAVTDMDADQLINRPGARVFAATTTGAAITLKAGARPQRNTQIVLYRGPR